MYIKMWTTIFILFFVSLRVNAFFDWNLHELQGPMNNQTFLTPKNILKVTPLLAADKNWKKARKEAKVKPFAGKVKSFAGFFTVNEGYESNMYFWYFLSEKATKKAPVILWLHGGPGQSSMMGLFEESGPYIIVNGQAVLRETSWTKHYNVLYIDNPIGAGFSYTKQSEGYSKTIDEAVDNLYEALRQFFKMFPEYKKNPFYVVGQSYGGKYIPVLANLIHKKNSENSTKINLKGMMIGCGCLDPVHQIAFADYLYEFGIIDRKGRTDVKSYETRSKNLLEAGYPLLAIAPLGLIGLKMVNAGFKYPLDIDNPHIDLSSYDEVEAFVTSDDVRKEIHVGNAEFHDKKMVLWYFKSDLLNSVSAELSKTLKLGYKVLMYAGQHDLVIPHEQTDKVIEHLEWDGAKKLVHSQPQPWYVDKELAGFSKSYANLQQVFVRKANHMIVRSQQKWMLDLLKKFVSG